MIRSTVPKTVLPFSAINKKTDHLRVDESQVLLLPNTAESEHQSGSSGKHPGLPKKSGGPVSSPSSPPHLLAQVSGTFIAE